MTFKGIDISEWQGSFSIDKIKDKIDFCIIRAGNTLYGGSGTTKHKDNRFEDNYRKCKAAGVPVGCYWYSCANSTAKGQAEAEYLYKNCLKGKQFEYPIFIDVENSQWQKNKKNTTDAIIAFCEYLESLGYFAGVYASLSWFNNYIDISRTNKYLRWVAAWQSSKPSTSWKYGLWQYSSKLSMNGMNVDGDYSYSDYAQIIKDGGFNGFPKKEPEPEPVPDPQPDPEPYVVDFTVGDMYKITDINGNVLTMQKIEKE